MKIEVERLFRFDGDGCIKALVDITLDNSVVIKGLKVVDGKKGLFVGLPCKQGKDGRFYETISILNEELKQAVESAVLRAYEQ